MGFLIAHGALLESSTTLDRRPVTLRDAVWRRCTEGGNVPQEWVEVNIVPTAPDQPERLLIDLIDGLVHTTFADQLAAWFFEWHQEPQDTHLRLRLRWRQLARSDRDCDDLFARLDEARALDLLGRWWEASHGKIGEVYEGEQ